jgi:cytochrome c-type biogenesis protein CcmE
LFAFNKNINVFYTPSQIASGEAPTNRPIRVGGLVVAVKRQPDSLALSFVLSDQVKTLRVHYQGILPDLFRKGQGIIAYGRLKANGELEASDVLAKHDENYMPAEVAKAIKAAGHPDQSAN